MANFMIGAHSYFGVFLSNVPVSKFLLWKMTTKQVRKVHKFVFYSFVPAVFYFNVQANN